MTCINYSCIRADASDWASGDKAPNDDQLERLTVGLEVFNTVADRDGEDLARSVMIGSGATLEGEEASPAMAIRVGEFDAARIAAQRYLEDAWR